MTDDDFNDERTNAIGLVLIILATVLFTALFTGILLRMVF